MNYQFRNLVFEGGGVKGVAYLGALELLEEKAILGSITRVGGTSAGAIIALLIGLNYSRSEIDAEVRALDFNKLLDDSFGVIRDTARLIEEYGWYKGDFFLQWAGDRVAAKTGNSLATFAEVAAMKGEKGFRDIYFMGTNLATGFSEIFSAEHTPAMRVAEAIRISMSIPLFFTARHGYGDALYVDGGVLDNFPVKLFDRQKYIGQNSRVPSYYKELNELLSQTGEPFSPYVYNQETLGFRLDSASEVSVFRDHEKPVVEKINDFFDYIKALMKTLLNVQEGNHLHSDDWQRTIYIDTLGVGATDFDLDDGTKRALVESGKKGAETYFAWYDNPASSPVNRP